VNTAAPLSPEAIHAVLLDAHNRVAALRGNVETVSTDSAFAIGAALGELSKAKALVGRDIDGARRRP
jgi:predicted RNA methylase